MESTIRRSQRDYTLAFKLSVVAHADQLEQGEMNYIKAQSGYGKQGPSIASMWLRKLGTQDWQNIRSLLLTH